MVTTTLFVTSSSILSPLFSLVAPVLFLLSLCVLLRRRIPGRHEGAANLPPMPAGGWPIIGNAHQILWNKQSFWWMHWQMEELNTNIACFLFGNLHIITITCPKIAREVLRRQDAIFASRPATFTAKTLCKYKTVVMSPLGDQWRKMKKVLTNELLSPAMEQRFHGKRVEEADRLMEHVYGQSKQPEGVNLRATMKFYATDVILRLVFNKSYYVQSALNGGPGPDEMAHVDALFTTMNNIYVFRVSEYFPALRGLGLDNLVEIIGGAMRTLNRLHDPIIDERIKQRRLLSGGDEREEPEDFLDVLISLKDDDGQPLLTVEEIKAQTIELLMAGAEPSNVVEWTLAELLNNPELLHKAMEEIDRVVGKERLVQESDICQLNYLKACIRESFRLHPRTPFSVPHVSVEDTTVANYFIPKGSMVLISRLALGRNPDIWDEPLKFKPERHLNDGSSNANVVLTEPDLRFITFSTGRRVCPAVSLGTCITVMLFARLLQGFTWSKLPGVAKIELNESVNGLSLAEPLVLRAEPRLPVDLYVGK